MLLSSLRLGRISLLTFFRATLLRSVVFLFDLSRYFFATAVTFGLFRLLAATVGLGLFGLFGLFSLLAALVAVLVVAAVVLLWSSFVLLLFGTSEEATCEASDGYAACEGTDSFTAVAGADAGADFAAAADFALFLVVFLRRFFLFFSIRTD